MAFGEKSIRKTKLRKNLVIATKKTVTKEVIETALHQYLVPMHIINHGDKIILDIKDEIKMIIQKKADGT